MAEPLALRNCESASLDSLPLFSVDEFRSFVIDAIGEGRRIAAMFGMPCEGRVYIYVVLAWDKDGSLLLASTDVQKSYLSITPKCPQSHLFEREIAEQLGVIPEGHPWLKPVRYPNCNGTVSLLGVTDFFSVDGEGVHEVAVGPVHAGVIEPGHFRFQCHGEKVINLEIALGYQHRGVERAIEKGDRRLAIHYAETLAGDTTIGHALAYAQTVESLCGFRAPPRAQAIRGIALELERIANHAGDLGVLAGDVGFLPTASFCGRIRGDILNLTAAICGSRFGRGLVIPGGCVFDIDAKRAEMISNGLEIIFRDLSDAAQLLWDSPSVLARFDDVGAISEETCRALGFVGPTARACGIPCDVREDFPVGIYRFLQIPVSTWHRGDVFARAFVRWLEINKSVVFIQGLLKNLPKGSVASKLERPRDERIAVSLVEGWRGEICHVAISGDGGNIVCYKIVDPSSHNWMALAISQRDCQISDFPLNNKSFNLSYCGHDL